MDVGIIQVLAMATRIACLRMTPQQLMALQGNVERASRVPGRSEWERKAAAHAEIFHLLADVADTRSSPRYSAVVPNSCTT